MSSRGKGNMRKMVKGKKRNMSKQHAPLTVEKMEDKGVRFVPKERGTHDGRLSLTADNLSSNWIYK